MASPAADLIVLDTLGKLYEHGHGITGHAGATSPYRSRSSSRRAVPRGFPYIPAEFDGERVRVKLRLEFGRRASSLQA
jgi:hypothetical protein